MKVAGTTTMDAPVERVWEAFLNPEVLVATIPGCERLEEVGEHAYVATVTAGVGSIKGAFQGKVHLSDLTEHQRLTLHAEAAGVTGTIDVEVGVTFTNLGGQTQVDYDADATVGGMIGGVGQRMLTSVSKRMANEFFTNVNRVLTGQVQLGGHVEEPPADAAPAQPGESPTVPAPVAPVMTSRVAAGGQDDFLKGLIAGALTTLLGVLVGVLAARRR